MLKTQILNKNYNYKHRCYFRSVKQKIEAAANDKPITLEQYEYGVQNKMVSTTLIGYKEECLA